MKNYEKFFKQEEASPGRTPAHRKVRFRNPLQPKPQLFITSGIYNGSRCLKETDIRRVKDCKGCGTHTYCMTASPQVASEYYCLAFQISAEETCNTQHIPNNHLKTIHLFSQQTKTGYGRYKLISIMIF